MKSKSFATPRQFECALDEHSADEKKKTMLAFFSSQAGGQGQGPAGHSASKAAILRKAEIQNKIHRNSATAAATLTAMSKRGSISDEIIGEEDLRDVDAVFESLLHSTFRLVFWAANTKT